MTQTLGDCMDGIGHGLADGAGDTFAQSLHQDFQRIDQAGEMLLELAPRRQTKRKTGSWIFSSFRMGRLARTDKEPYLSAFFYGPSFHSRKESMAVCKTRR